MIFDILGRRWTVSIMFLTGAAATVPFPFGKDLGPGRIWFFNFFKVVLNCTIMALLMNPFINDYVKVQDRGIAMGVQNTGLVLGTLASVGVLYTLTSRLAYDVAFPFLAVLQIVWVVIILGGGLIQEPNQMTEREEKRMNRKSFCGKMYSIIKQTYKACNRDHALGIALIAISIARMGTMLQQVTFYNWIISYTPESFDIQTAKSIWQQQNLITNFCGIPASLITGKLSDRVSAKILIPGALLF